MGRNACEKRSNREQGVFMWFEWAELVLLGEMRDLAVRTQWGGDCRSWDVENPSKNRKGIFTHWVKHFYHFYQSLTMEEKAPEEWMERVRNSRSSLSAGDFHSGVVLQSGPDQASLVPVSPVLTVSLPWAKATTYRAIFCPASFPSPWLLSSPSKAENKHSGVTETSKDTVSGKA